MDTVTIDITLTVLDDEDWRDSEAMNAFLSYNDITWNLWKKVTFNDEAWDSDNEGST